MNTNKNRPYFNLSALELTTVLSKSQNDPDILMDLYLELKIRDTKLSKKLLNQVEEYIRNEFPEELVTSPNSNKPLKKKSATKTNYRKKIKTQKSKISTYKDSTTLKQDHGPAFTYSSDFKKISKPGTVTGTDEKWIKPLKTDIELDLPKGASILEKQTTALDLYIEELIETKKNKRYFTLFDGKLVESSGKKYVYSFPFDENIELFEGALVDINIGSTNTQGRVTSFFDRSIFIEMDQHFGPEINSCTVIFDQTAMLKALLEKLQASEEVSFSEEMAEEVFLNKSREKKYTGKEKVYGLKGLNEDQKKAVRGVLSNKCFFIWGPPGTGKTHTLATLIENFYHKDEKTLLASNTNQAVDQALLKLCQALTKNHQAIKNGEIIRRGKIEHPELQKWQKYINLDDIVAKKSAKLTNKKEALETKLQDVNKSIESLELSLSVFREIDI